MILNNYYRLEKGMRTFLLLFQWPKELKFKFVQISYI